MAQKPCIKGTAISTVVEDIKRLVDEGHIWRENLELRLEASDLLLLEAKIESVSWYDINAYRRMMELLRDVEGAGDPHYWFRRGARSAAHLIEHFAIGHFRAQKTRNRTGS